MQYSTATADTDSGAVTLKRGQKQLLRRYQQACARSERNRIAYEAAAAARARYLVALLDAGISQRNLAELVGISRRQVRVLVSEAIRAAASAPSGPVGSLLQNPPPGWDTVAS